MDAKKILAACGGDYEGTMRRLMGNEMLFCRLLPKMFQDKNLQKLEEALTLGDLDAAFDAAHTLKGMSGNLGLASLYDAVCEIVEPLRRKDPEADYSALYQAIQREFLRLEALLRQMEAGEQQSERTR